MEASRRQRVLGVLMRDAWFAGLEPSLRDEILDRSVVRTFEKGQFLVHETDAAPGLLALLDGRVALLRHVGEDDEVVVHVCEVGFWWGEVPVLAGLPSVVSAVALTDVRVLLLPTGKFEQIVAVRPGSYRQFARLALTRYALVVRYLSEERMLPPLERLRVRLADLADIKEPRRPVVAPIDLNVSQTNLASLVGVSRQTINRLLRQLQAERLVDLSFQKISVLDPVALRGAHAAAGIVLLPSCTVSWSAPQDRAIVVARERRISA